MKKLSLALVLAASLIGIACGSEPSVDSTPTDNGGNGGSDVTPPTGGNGGGQGGGGGVGGNADPQPDAGGGTGGDTDAGTGGGGGGDTDGGTGGGGDTDAGTGGGGGDTDAGTGGGGGGDTDAGTGGGDTDGGSGGGGGDTDGGSGGGDTDGGTGGGGGGDQDGGSGGGDTDGGGDTCHVHSCVLTQGYYKLHTVDWTGPSIVMGGETYTQHQYVDLLKTPSGGDGSLILAKQLIAALLNGGACDLNASATVQAAQDWMAANKDADGRLTYGTACVNQGDPGCAAIALGATLDQYNNGNSGTPHCN